MNTSRKYHLKMEVRTKYDDKKNKQKLITFLKKCQKKILILPRHKKSFKMKKTKTPHDSHHISENSLTHPHFYVFACAPLRSNVPSQQSLLSQLSHVSVPSLAVMPSSHFWSPLSTDFTKAAHVFSFLRVYFRQISR